MEIHPSQGTPRAIMETLARSIGSLPSKKQEVFSKRDGHLLENSTWNSKVYFAGPDKAGKSTLQNFLGGHHILPIGVAVTTIVPTHYSFDRTQSSPYCVRVVPMEGEHGVLEYDDSEHAVREFLHLQMTEADEDKEKKAESLRELRVTAKSNDSHPELENFTFVDSQGFSQSNPFLNDEDLQDLAKTSQLVLVLPIPSGSADKTDFDHWLQNIPDNSTDVTLVLTKAGDALKDLKKLDRHAKEQSTVEGRVEKLQEIVNTKFVSRLPEKVQSANVFLFDPYLDEPYSSLSYSWDSSTRRISISKQKCNDMVSVGSTEPIAELISSNERREKTQRIWAQRCKEAEMSYRRCIAEKVRSYGIKTTNQRTRELVDSEVTRLIDDVDKRMKDVIRDFTGSPVWARLDTLGERFAANDKEWRVSKKKYVAACSQYIFVQLNKDLQKRIEAELKAAGEDLASRLKNNIEDGGSGNDGLDDFIVALLWSGVGFLGRYAAAEALVAAGGTFAAGAAWYYAAATISVALAAGAAAAAIASICWTRKGQAKDLAKELAKENSDLAQEVKRVGKSIVDKLKDQKEEIKGLILPRMSQQGRCEMYCELVQKGEDPVLLVEANEAVAQLAFSIPGKIRKEELCHPESLRILLQHSAAFKRVWSASGSH